MLTRTAIATALAAAAIGSGMAACGSSTTSSSQRGQVVADCVLAGSSWNSCACTVDQATASGVTLGTISREAGKGTDADPRLVAAALACEGR